MAEFQWTAVSPLAPVIAPSETGGAATVRISEVRGFGLYQVMARRGQVAVTAAAARGRFGIVPPAGPGAATSADATLLWSGPDQFQVLVDRPKPGTPQDLRNVFGGAASIVDLSDARCFLRVAGQNARDTLCKLCSVDLHESMFPVGAAAATSIDHTTVNLWREADRGDGAPSFGLFVFTSFAGSIWHSLVEAAAEFRPGIAIETSAA